MARRKAREATPEYLERVALWYLERYPGSEARLRRALGKRVARSVAELGTDAGEGAAHVEAVVNELRRRGFVDDARFARARIRALRRKGTSGRAVVATLMRQGIDRDLAVQLLHEHSDASEGGPPELMAARAFVRRRRLGRYRRRAVPSDEARAAREKDLGRLARAGFSFDIAARVLDEIATSDAETP